ncbi:vWA domain-containing protein [Brevibacillus sp. B_LB10_24]|uniref:vWA domain-containing protein n=1 Tax=Brevibacillus sp. B_LB10_24 TaxID=3380645 RepID=UPI0038BB1745
MARLSARVLAFGRHLRECGFSCGPGEAIAALQALTAVDISDETQFRLALRLVFSSSREEQEKFDQLYQRFFHLSGNVESDSQAPLFSAASGKEAVGAEGKTGQDKADSSRPFDGFGMGLEHAAEHQEQGSRSRMAEGMWRAARTSRHSVDHQAEARVLADQLGEMLSSAKSVAASVRLKRSRRWRTEQKGRRLDFRGTLRSSLQTGGDAFRPAWKGHPLRKAQFVLLCDTSRSMAGAAERFLQFAYALTRCPAARVEVFLFSTRLRRVTRLLHTGLQGSLPALMLPGAEWGGGTRIGESLDDFVQRYGSAMLKQNTVVLIASDGLDTGPIEPLARAMQELQRRSARVVWLNPLLSISGYEPKARGMQAALPFIDMFLPAGDAAAFRTLAKQMMLRR